MNKCKEVLFVVFIFFKKITKRNEVKHQRKIMFLSQICYKEIRCEFCGQFSNNNRLKLFPNTNQN